VETTIIPEERRPSSGYSAWDGKLIQEAVAAAAHPSACLVRLLTVTTWIPSAILETPCFPSQAVAHRNHAASVSDLGIALRFSHLSTQQAELKWHIGHIEALRDLIRPGECLRRPDIHRNSFLTGIQRL